MLDSVSHVRSSTSGARIHPVGAEPRPGASLTRLKHGLAVLVLLIPGLAIGVTVAFQQADPGHTAEPYLFEHIHTSHRYEADGSGLVTRDV